MITIDERRKIATKLRELANANEGCLGIDRVNRVLRDGQAILGTSGLASVADVLRKHADLIDRPTATATMDYEAMEDGIPDCRIWTCNGCKESFPVYRGFYPTYCPACGAEIEK